MSRGRKPRTSKKTFEQYDHRGAERVNNPPVGLVSPELNGFGVKKRHEYDSHLDPQLVWAGKAERTSFDVDTVSLHVHERIEPKTIIEAVRSRKGPQQVGLLSFFGSPGENPPLRDAVAFYQHKHGWSNRLIAGDSLLVMNSLLEKEGMREQVQMIYIDPPYGIGYGSNFQPFVNKRIVKDGKDEDLTQEPEMIKAFRDTWELGIHSYLTYLRDRLLLARELLTESGSVFMQISDENIHHVRELLDEIFGSKNFCALIVYRTSAPLGTKGLATTTDYVLWYAKNIDKRKNHDLFVPRDIGEGTVYTLVESRDGTHRRMTTEERLNPSLIPKDVKVFCTENLVSSGYTPTCIFPFEYKGKTYKATSGKSWKTNRDGMIKLAASNRLDDSGDTLRYVLYWSDYPVMKLTTLWSDMKGESEKQYVVQTATKVIQRCMLLASDPGDLVFDPTCGSGTTAYVAEQWGRRWVTCDTSRVAIALAKQRLITALYDYYELKDPKLGVESGFNYKTVPHVTMKSISNDMPPEIVELYDQPAVDNDKVRVTGPFTVEAVPAPYVKPLDEIPEESEPDSTISRSGETLRQGEWRSEIFKTGIRGKGGQRIEFSRVETLSGTRWLHADAETKEAEPKRVVLSFGPEHAPLEQRQVTLALEEASHLFPRPTIVVFAAFQFDPEASKDIDEAQLPGVTLLKVQMNADLLTEDLKKKRSSNESFWLIGHPEVEIRHLTGVDAGKIQVEVKGFDYYNTRTGEIDSGGPQKIAMWMLDTDYDFRSVFPRQVFFPIAAEDEGWSRLARILKAEVSPELIDHYRGTVSLPFKPGNAIAIKIIDDRGIESLKIIRM